MKKFIFSVLTVLAFSLSTVMGADGVVTTTANIGGKTANLVYVDMSKNGRTGEVVMSSQLKPEAASSLIGKTSSKAVAAMNGGFFNAYYDKSKVSFPSNYPVIYGTVISNGEILNGGYISAPALVFDSKGMPHIGDASIVPYYTVNDENPTQLSGVNKENNRYFNDKMKASVYVPAGESVAYIKNGIVTGNVVSSGVNVGIPQGTAILLGEKSLKVGDKVRVMANVTLDGKLIDAVTVVTCGPMLVNEGKIAVSVGSTYDSKQAADAVAQRSFAAVAKDGRLILGTVVSSPNKMASYLQSIGATDALMFDGGASSMLYADGHGFKTKAGRELASIFAVVDKTPTNTVYALPNTVKLSLNGNVSTISCYNINNTNYFKIRGIAELLKNTNSKFRVGWDSANNTVSINKGESPEYYDTRAYYSTLPATQSSSAVTVDGSPVGLTAYNIGGNNYFSLRDVATIVGADVSWDSANKQVVIKAY